VARPKLGLFVEVDQSLENRAATTSRLATQLQLRLGDQRIDGILADPDTTRLRIHALARRDGIRL
jgi:hypothetical protein